MLLYPRNSSEDYCSSLKLNIDATEPTRYFLYSNVAKCEYRFLSSFKNLRCECGSVLDRFVSVESDKVCNGFVKDSPNFIVTDDLTVLPNSMDANFGLLKRFGIKSTSLVKEVNMDITEKQVNSSMKGNTYSFFLFDRSIGFKLRLFVRKTDGEILFAQGEEDFVDFLFSFLTFCLGSIDSLYASISDLDRFRMFLNETYTRLKLVDPKSSKEGQEGYAKGPALFMITNDLVIEPMSQISALSLLNRFETPPSNVTEKDVFIGLMEGFTILKAALTIDINISSNKQSQPPFRLQSGLDLNEKHLNNFLQKETCDSALNSHLPAQIRELG
ncbi:uncharacterized protein [Medicago truncatula]|uniref:uncharacterized protein n=1 Tax=Medicago truncatula TaxID=3880 RepID=UPI000D2F1EB4|nr:uncharacterized protein LOC11411241 [Medicago truncatula]